jgi:hypothetical protein
VVTVAGAMTWTNGTITDTNAGVNVNFNVNGGLVMSGGSGKVLDGRAMNLSSNAAWSAGNVVLSNNAVLNINAGGTLDIQADLFVDDATSTLGVGEQFINSGVIVKTGGTG